MGKHEAPITLKQVRTTRLLLRANPRPVPRHRATLTIDMVREDWESDVDPAAVAVARRLVESGDAKWVWDPDVNGVVALQDKRSARPTAFIVVFNDGGWVASSPFEDMVARHE